MYNVGMKSRKTKGNSESYKQLLGSLAQNGVLLSDKYSYTRGHSFGGAFDTVLQKHVLLGISTSSKVWALEDNRIRYLVEWCKSLSRKIGDPEMDKLESPLSELDCGRIADKFPDENIFFADWDSMQYHKFTNIVFLDHDEEPVEEALLCSCSIIVLEQHENFITLLIHKGNGQSKIIYSIKPKVDFIYAEDTIHKIAISRGNSFGNTISFLAIISNNPINIFYESLSKLIGRVFFEFDKNNIKTISNSQIHKHNWPMTVNVHKEYYTQQDIQDNVLAKDARYSIHDYIIEQAKLQFDVVFYDHGSLEIADVIGFKNGAIRFYHCKKQSGPIPNCSVDDLYEVCGQSVKSVNWANRGLLIKQICDRADYNNSHDKIKKGSLELIKSILNSFDNPIIPIEITIVQPGLKTENLFGTQLAAFERIKILLSGVESFLKDVSSCNLSIMCS